MIRNLVKNLASKGRTRIEPSGEPILSFINRVCNDVGPRIGGSDQEKQAGELIFEEFSSFCDLSLSSSRSTMT